MKVLHVIPAVSPEYGGPSHALVPMCTSLRARGVEVQIAGTDATPHGHLPFELGKPTEFQGVPAIFFRKEASESFKYSPGLARWLHKHVATFDVVHIHGFFSHACWSAATACTRVGVPYVIRPLGNLEQWSLSQKAFKKKLFLRFGGHSLLKGAAALHYVCAREKELSETALKLNHGVIIPIGIRPPERISSGAGQLPYVLVLSRLHPSKGIDVLLKAFLSLREGRAFADWRLVIAGDGVAGYKADLRRIVNSAGLSDSVLFPGWLEGERKAEALAQASLMALPSHHEPFGICLLEAFAQGVPVLAGTEVGLADEIKAAGAGWISPVNVEALSNTLRQALSDSRERGRRGDAGRALARKFDLEIMAEMLSDLYNSICAGRK